MTAAELVPWITQGGVVGVVAWVFALLHRSAIRSESRRADDWRAAAHLERARSDELSRQLATVLSAVRSTAGTT